MIAAGPAVVSSEKFCVCCTTPRFHNRFWQVKTSIGRGTYGRVDVYRSYCGEEVAVKSSFYKREARREAAILKQLGFHPNIIGFYDFLPHEGNLCDLLMMELGSMNLFDYLRSQFRTTPPDSVIHNFATQLLSGLHHLHSRCIVHLDLKSGNVIFGQNGTVKLADFGLSQHCFNSTSGQYVMLQGATGTQQICPPEAFTNEWYDAMKCDVWAFGILLLEMKNLGYSWNKPVYSDFRYYRYLKTKNCVTAPQGSLQELIDGILTHDWKIRPSLNQVGAHVWFSAFNHNII